ncbi:Ppx/GppA phosphatase family protein [Corynebacterium sp. MSK006]|uniref:Ppx/GppA phosphatase family protein n=1 Tax=Corynebacterium sp. MSK006 TaxID=3050187 RepID=UPI00254EC7E4|nr:Ppx/GppA phosphatase family protein [Corynebacterium sp. MSK006]MDK8895006.1 Ppx/GppA phosphatase family protein [Corynebacterium sp. MSK006]
MTRLAAVDCGTNSIRLLVSEVGPAGRIRDLHREMKIVRLGQGVDATGELDSEAIERTRAALAHFVEIMRHEHVEKVRMVATSATRDATNRHDFFDMTAELLGQVQEGARAEVITGEEEAELSFRGAIGDLAADRGPFLVIDLGGGSTEFVVGDAENGVAAAHSTQMGCVRLTERIMRADPPTATEIEIARDYVEERLDRVRTLLPLSKVRTVVGCAGTFTTLSALAQGLEEYDPDAIHGSELNFSALRLITQMLISESSSARAANPVIHPGRADVIGSGSVIVEQIMDLAKESTQATSFVISEKDILDGIIAGLAEG